MTKTPDTSPYVRTPTVKDRHRLPMQCVVRPTPKDEWKPALLVDIFSHSSHNFAVVPSDAPPAGVKAGKIKVEMYRECLIRNKAPTPAESIIDSLVPFPNGTWVKVIDGKHKNHVGVVINDSVSPHAVKIKVNPNLNIMVLTQHLEELPANHVPDNVTPPKFGIGDPVYYDSSDSSQTLREYRCGLTFYVQSSIHTSWGWLYKIINMNPDGTIQCQLTDIPEAELTPAENKVNVLDLSPTPQENNTVVNEQGGKQSHLDARFDCIPPVVLRLLAQCLGFGARKYGKDNWKNIPQWDHLNHAVNHINEWNRGNRDEPHLVNAMARLTFALWQAVDTNQQPDTYQHPDQLK
jgi:hypothetical protein